MPAQPFKLLSDAESERSGILQIFDKYSSSHIIFNVIKIFERSVFTLFALFLFSITAVNLNAQTTNPADVTPREFQIAKITVTGEETRSANMIIATSGLQVGESVIIPGTALGESIKRLFRTGLFSDVQIYETGRSGSQIDLEIRVREQPRLDSFEITGPKRSERRDLRDQIPLIPGFAVTESSKSQAVNAINRYFRDKGYRYTEVNIIETERDTLRNRVKLLFDIDRGERIQIREIVFEGNDNFRSSKLRSELKEIKRTTFWRGLTRQTFDRDSYREAQENLLNFYKRNGFRDIRIVEDSVYVFDHTPSRKGIGVFMKLYEGPQYHVRNITFEGNEVYTDEQLQAALEFENGDVFNEERFQMNIYGNRQNTDIYSLYHDNGYVFLQIEDNIQVVEGDSLDINLLLIEDEKATIRTVEFMGNTKTHDHVVRRNLRNLPGGFYSRSAIQRSVRELATLGYFVPENIIPDLDPNYENKTVDIYYSLDESTGTDNFELSGGFGGRQFGVILSARINFNNFSAQNIFNGETWRPLPTGDGQRLSLGVQLTGRGYRSYNFGFQEPWLFGRPNSLGLSAYYSFLRFSSGVTGQDERYENFGTALTLGRRLTWPDDFFTQTTVLQYQYFQAGVNRGLIEAGAASTISIKFGLDRNSLDNFISPNVGSKFNISLELAPPLPGFKQYYLGEIGFQQHIPIVGKLVLTSGFEYGYLGWFSDKDRSQYQRFYLGGTQLQQQQTFYENNIDLRGFPGGRNGSISPFNGFEPIGGRIYSKYITELRYPAVTSEQVQLIPYLFAEGGNSYRDFNDFDPFNVKRAVGIGTRIFLPILGLVDLSYGYRLDGIPNTRVRPGQWEFLFNIGAPF
jgi:outer membrane protein insertion porin family